MGADVRHDSAGFDIGIRPSWEEALADVARAGGLSHFLSQLVAPSTLLAGLVMSVLRMKFEPRRRNSALGSTPSQIRSKRANQPRE
jgi:hypothetical protein